MGQFTNARGEDAGVITHSDFQHAPGTRDRFTVHLTCEDCGQIGTITWEENDADLRQERRVIDVSPGFHTETGRTESGGPHYRVQQMRCDLARLAGKPFR